MTARRSGSPGGQMSKQFSHLLDTVGKTLSQKSGPDQKELRQLIMKVCVNSPEVTEILWAHQPAPRDPIPGGEGKTYFDDLLEAIADNTHLVKVQFANVELQPEEVKALARSLEKNTSITHLDISSNKLRPELVVEVGEALKRNPEAAIKELIVDQAGQAQQTTQQEETFATLIQKTPSMTKLGMKFENSSWNQVASTALLNNNDAARRLRKRTMTLNSVPEVVQQDREMAQVKVTLLEAPEASSQDEHFSKENSGDQAYRAAIAALSGRIPDARALQGEAVKVGVQGMGYANANAVLQKGLRSLLNAAVGTSVSIHGQGPKRVETIGGELRRWVPEDNGSMLLEVKGTDSDTYMIRIKKTPTLTLTKSWQDWLL